MVCFFLPATAMNAFFMLMCVMKLNARNIFKG
ncbi:TPA: hemolysin-activating lysine-acyltransferase HlyC, partial [Escherichia coli]|nr:hemolysin-activating lysine-acyltransferase HlyC [Escherichia coli]